MMACAGCGGPAGVSPISGKPRKWCSERCRKRSYGDPCVDCGKRTGFGAEAARVPEPRCPDCSREHRRIWTSEAIICAIQDWAAEHGEPPAIPDWNGWQSRNNLHDEHRARRYETQKDRWPSHTEVYRLCGSWNDALRAAGFEPRPAHGGGGNQYRQRRCKRLPA